MSLSNSFVAKHLSWLSIQILLQFKLCLIIVKKVLLP